MWKNGCTKKIKNDYRQRIKSKTNFQKIIFNIKQLIVLIEYIKQPSFENWSNFKNTKELTTYYALGTASTISLNSRKPVELNKL